MPNGFREGLGEERGDKLVDFQPEDLLHFLSALSGTTRV